MHKRQRVEGSLNRVFCHVWGKRGRKKGEFYYPWGVTLDEHGLVYVSDKGNHRIQCFQADGTFVRSWGRHGQRKGEFDTPSGLSTNMYGKRKQSVYKVMGEIGRLAAFPPGILPLCIAYVGDECIAVADTHNHRIQVFETDGTFIRKWGRVGTGPNEFKYPLGCAIDVAGTIYVADSSNSRIQCFHSNGTFIRMWAIEGSQSYTIFQFLAGICVSSKNAEEPLIYITDHGSVNCYKPDGTVVCKLTSPSAQPDSPHSIAADEDDETIFVADNDTNCITQYRKDGTSIRSWGKKGRRDGQFHLPSGMAKSAHGLLYVADTFNNRIVAIKIQTT